MNENLNLVEILKDCPEGTKLYTPIFGEVELGKIDIHSNHPIHVLCKYGEGSFSKDGSFSKYGRIHSAYDGECLLFPSKEQRDWSKFKIKKPKFDPKTFQPFDKVLVRTGTKRFHVWLPDLISIPPNEVDKTILCMTIDTDIIMAIPYNDDTKHLLGTNKEAPEFYRYWED